MTWQGISGQNPKNEHQSFPIMVHSFRFRLPPERREVGIRLTREDGAAHYFCGVACHEGGDFGDIVGIR